MLFLALRALLKEIRATGDIPGKCQSGGLDGWADPLEIDCADLCTDRYCCHRVTIRREDRRGHTAHARPRFLVFIGDPSRPDMQQ
ncbi:hypothetical protein K8P10_002694 [Leucobacter sp. Psy1]|nr:hypothetical protein K8P10_002694 [Leucobacter sp. Psy1]